MYIMNKHYDSKYLFVGVAIALAAFFLFTLLSKDSVKLDGNDNTNVDEDTLVNENLIRRYSDGVLISEEDQIKRLYAVMVENSAEAWPLIGLADARLVFEAPVEGAIPRFMLLFDDQQEVEQIGPVRSARPYYVEWANGLDAMYAHVGGSPEGLQLIKTLGVKDLNEFFWGQFFWRSKNRYAPHNVYTSTEELAEAYETREFDDQELSMLFNYKDEAGDEQRGEAQFISIPFSPVSSIYNAGWEYQKEENRYQRYQRNDKQIEMDKAEVFAKNVIVVFSDISVIDEVGRRKIRTTGKGDALLFKDGQQEQIMWNKDSQKDMLEFVNEEGEQVLLNAGPTWVEVISIGSDVVIN